MKNRMNEIKEQIKLAYYVRRPVFLWGHPGIGKSSLVHQAARELGILLIDIRLTLLNPDDLRGAMKIVNGQTKWYPPSFLPRRGDGILFIDELNLAPLAVQHAAYQLILDRKLGEYKLPAGFSTVAAGNYESDACGVYRLPMGLSNRFLHIPVPPPNIEEWSEWAYSNNINPYIIAFLNHFPVYLFKFDPKSQEKAWPSHRSWEFASDILNASEKLYGYYKWENIKLAVGQGAASAFCDFVALRESLPTIEEMLRDPNKAEIPTDVGLLWALSSSLADWILRKQEIVAAIPLIDKFPKEYQIFILKVVLSADKTNKLANDLYENAAGTEKLASIVKYL